jgi:hypothetical protein
MLLPIVRLQYVAIIPLVNSQPVQFMPYRRHRGFGTRALNRDSAENGLGIALRDVTERSVITQARPDGGDHLERGTNGEHPEEAQQAHRSQTKKGKRKGEQEKQVHRGVSARGG